MTLSNSYHGFVINWNNFFPFAFTRSTSMKWWLFIHKGFLIRTLQMYVMPSHLESLLSWFFAHSSSFYEKISTWTLYLETFLAIWAQIHLHIAQFSRKKVCECFFSNKQNTSHMLCYYNQFTGLLNRLLISKNKPN